MPYNFKNEFIFNAIFSTACAIFLRLLFLILSLDPEVLQIITLLFKSVNVTNTLVYVRLIYILAAFFFSEDLKKNFFHFLIYICSLQS